MILSRNYRVEEAAILWYFALDIGNRLFSVFWLVHGRILQLIRLNILKCFHLATLHFSCLIAVLMPFCTPRPAS